MIEAAPGLARQWDDRSVEIELLLHLATARQYPGEHDRARALFQDVLQRSAAFGVAPGHVHFILHHQGRCSVEQGHIPAAPACVERTLSSCVALGMQRFIPSTEAAIAEPGRWPDRTKPESRAPDA